MSATGEQCRRWDGLESAAVSMKPSILDKLELRLGRLHARQRLGIERDHEAQIFGQGLNFFHIENWYSVHAEIRGVLKIAGLYQRGLRNASRIQIFDTTTSIHQNCRIPPPQRSAYRHE